MLLAFGEFWKRYVDFKGKTDRRTFWLTVLAELLVLFICGLSHALLATYLYESDSLPYLLIALCCAMLVPTAALMVRRLRDAGYAWGWVFLFFLSLPGWIALAALSAKPSGAKRKTAAPDSEPVALKTAPESRRKADEQILANPQGGDCTTKAETRSAPKKNRIWLWILGWIFVYPVPVTLLLRRSRLRSFGKTALIILAWIPYFTSIVLAFGNSERPATSGEQETFLSNAELLTEVYPTLQQIDACEKSESAPAATENFLILRLDEKRQKIIAKNINGDHKLSEQLTRADAEALDLIVVAVTDSFTRLYAPYANGERLEGTVTFWVEKAGIYFFDPKTGTVFDESSVRAYDLHQQESGYRRQFKLSNYQIIKAVDEKYHLELGVPLRFVQWFTQVGFLVLIVLVFALLLFFLLRTSWQTGQERKRASY